MSLASTTRLSVFLLPLHSFVAQSPQVTSGAEWRVRWRNCILLQTSVEAETFLVVPNPTFIQKSLKRIVRWTEVDKHDSCKNIKICEVYNDVKGWEFWDTLKCFMIDLYVSWTFQALAIKQFWFRLLLENLMSLIASPYKLKTIQDDAKQIFWKTLRSRLGHFFLLDIFGWRDGPDRFLSVLVGVLSIDIPILLINVVESPVTVLNCCKNSRSFIFNQGCFGSFSDH